VIPLTLEAVTAACRGVLEAGDSQALATGVAIDSRQVKPGDLFVALRGEAFDGGDFAAEALGAGAVAVVVTARTAATLRAGAPRIVVDDGQQALGDLAAAVRRRSGAAVVAVTGSVGKTSTKDVLAALLAPVARVVATSGNHNNEIGVPLTVFELEPSTEVLVCELAMRGPGQIAQLAAIVRPDVGVITNIAPVHLEHVGSIEGVAAAKAEIIAEVGKGALVVPAGEALLEPHLRYHTGRLVTFGDEGANVCVAEAQPRGFGTHALIDAFGRRAAFDFPFSGGHYLQDALAAIAAFIALGYTLEEAKPGAAAVVFSALRGKLEELPRGGLLLNDAYNANPLSMKAAIDHLCAVAGERPRVAVLGDMFELGAGASGFHREVGRYAAAKGVRVLAVGVLSRDYLTAPGGTWYPTVEECLAALPQAIAPGSAILVKASRAMRIERVAEAILAPPAPGGSAAAAADASTPLAPGSSTPPAPDAPGAATPADDEAR
jgi:UDP-N-acetylmuramoyl-tripeptide--D-alanyl-D-alanine ligase